MNTFLADLRGTLVPGRNGKHGPLPPLLLALTFLTGLVDAFSYLVLGHVFVANMTGNVVFLGFALAGAPGFSIAASVVALVSFWSGALIGGKVGSRLGGRRGRLLNTAASIQAVFLAASVVLGALAGNAMTAGFRYPLIVVLGIAMGIQNATARKLAVPDLTTTVLTLTITGTAADQAVSKRDPRRRRHWGGPGTSALLRPVRYVQSASAVKHGPKGDPTSQAPGSLPRRSRSRSRRSPGKGRCGRE